MTRQRHGSESAVQIITGRWTIALLAELSERGRRYLDLHEALDGISNRVLTDRLQRAERDGLVTRQLDPGRVETATLYEFTDLGRSLDGPIAMLNQWVSTKLVVVETARRNPLSSPR
jgi:DNA-binding HxlR family transcriptional regulator